MAGVAVVAVSLLSCPAGSCTGEVPTVAILVAVESIDRSAASTSCVKLDITHKRSMGVSCAKHVMGCQIWVDAKLSPIYFAQEFYAWLDLCVCFKLV